MWVLFAVASRVLRYAATASARWHHEGRRSAGSVPKLLSSPLRASVAAVRAVARSAALPGDTIGGVTGRAAGARTPGEVKAAVLRLLWQQRLATDLHSRLDADSALEVTA
jgi:hypothetical protein